MSNTIRHRILDLLEARLRCAMVKSALLSPPDDSLRASELMARATVSGTYNATFPRMFTIAVSAPNTVSITETTYWADKGPSHPANFTFTGAYVKGTPFQISTTGVYVTLGTLSVTGDSWVLRLANASETIQSIEQYRTAWNDEPFPRLSVFASTDEPSGSQVGEYSTKQLQINLLLDVSDESRNTRRIEEILGDIENELNRDVYFYDNTECLSQNCEFRGSQLYDADIGSISFVMTFDITYRNKLNDTRSK